MHPPETRLWQPSEEFQKNSNLSHFINWLRQYRNLSFASYDQLWKWSTDEFETFWQILLDYFHIQFDGHYSQVISTHNMPGVRWFEGIRLNYSEHIFRNATGSRPAIIASSESGRQSVISWNELKRQVTVLQHFLKKSGIQKGDRVVGFLPNIPEATVALLATNSLGAIWSGCSPDFGTQAVADRF